MKTTLFTTLAAALMATSALADGAVGGTVSASRMNVRAESSLDMRGSHSTHGTSYQGIGTSSSASLGVEMTSTDRHTLSRSGDGREATTRTREDTDLVTVNTRSSARSESFTFTEGNGYRSDDYGYGDTSGAASVRGVGLVGGVGYVSN